MSVKPTYKHLTACPSSQFTGGKDLARTRARESLFLVLLWGNDLGFEHEVFGGGDIFLFSVLIGDGIFLSDSNVVGDDFVPLIDARNLLLPVVLHEGFEARHELSTELFRLSLLVCVLERNFAGVWVCGDNFACPGVSFVRERIEPAFLGLAVLGGHYRWQ